MFVPLQRWNEISRVYSLDPNYSSCLTLRKPRETFEFFPSGGGGGIRLSNPQHAPDFVCTLWDVVGIRNKWKTSGWFDRRRGRGWSIGRRSTQSPSPYPSHIINCWVTYRTYLRLPTSHKPILLTFLTYNLLFQVYHAICLSRSFVGIFHQEHW